LVYPVQSFTTSDLNILSATS